MKEFRAVIVAKTASLWKRLLKPLRLDVTLSAASRETHEDEGTGSLLTVMPPQTTVGVRLKLKEYGVVASSICVNDQRTFDYDTGG
ncbi:hypothetical protein RS3R6_38560 [Pseudomonas atacamensis]|uniref:Uncharacterized protein n=1 Tax=Pseudomonas atacamensis TaxID=2565368 RepID=A0ABQ5PP62_9PSED|nr:hypothetical protein RS3R1_42750 [Pseudomonas atacamensis]GLH55674.1 hypothetical protein RS3R6_38560 [Pseudomonas atacamensis]